MEIGTREPIWTGHEVGSRCADHGQKREPGEGHKTLSKHENDAVGPIGNIPPAEAEANHYLLIHESPLTDALFLLVSKSDEVTTT